MNKKNVIGYLQSIIAIPMLAIGMPLSGVNPIIDFNIAPIEIAKENSAIITQEEVARKEKAEAIDSYFKSHDAPLEGYGMKFVLEAEKNNLDWRLLPAIAMRETTGGKQMCKNPKAPNNAFGWGSCKMGFSSIDKSIEHIAKSISGNNPNLKAYKIGMTSGEILKKYNPDHIIPGYSLQVIKIMNSINEIV
jgi:hypothetical protein